MVLSRFFLVVTALALGVSGFLLSVALSIYSRSASYSQAQALSADSQVVSWYLKDEARTRAGLLVKFALEPSVARHLSRSSRSTKPIESKERAQVKAALARVNDSLSKELAFDSVFAVDRKGRVVAALNYEAADGQFDLGGYSVVADALHGYVRDDTLLWQRLYRVVARPVEYIAGSAPAGAIVGIRAIDDRFSRAISERTGAAVAFYVDGKRIAAGAPDGFATAHLDQIVSDLSSLEQDVDYQELGRSSIHEVGGTMRVQYTRMVGEAYHLGAGYAVAKMGAGLKDIRSFFELADDVDVKNGNLLAAGGAALILTLFGLLLTYFEHSKPLRLMKLEADRLAQGEIEQLQVSRFSGLYRKMAAELNEGMDRLVTQGDGRTRRAADLKDVLGEMPQESGLAAFAVPNAETALSSKDKAPSSELPPAVPLKKELAVGADREESWPDIFEKFLALKAECGEDTSQLSYEKFQATLSRHQKALAAQHGATGVKFRVYIKEGKAALKASPLRD